MDETSQSIGALQARVEILESEVKGLRDDVRQLLEIVSTSKGSIRALAALFGVAATLGAGAATVISWFWFKS